MPGAPYSCSDKAPETSYIHHMSVAELIDAVKELSEEEKREFLDRLTEIDFDDAWDRQIEADAKAGRLDHLWQQALEDIEAGHTKPLDEVLNNS